MAIVDLTAVITLNPGKLQRIVDEFNHIQKWVKANEPGVLQYELTKGLPEKNSGADVVLIREVYASEDAQQAHFVAPITQRMIKTMEDEKFIKTINIVFTQPKPDSGFLRTSRL
ncbi:hypothetical protein GE09DRAFT_1119236 [Coniochaeta sp. 2T2.1]|nr:hypothetical protein GE09DRAFT_1119236 [Coniochaeta sp. 2T2.1]